jgi:N-acetylmuramoyl-L-alanine amidase
MVALLTLDRVVNISNVSKLIVIDPGHNYGGDYGAEKTFNGVKYSETELNMQVAVKLQARLKGMGYNVVLTRQPWDKPMDDLKTSLQNRANLANSLNADLFISLHHNSVDNSTTANGISTYYSTYKPALKNLQKDLIPLTSGFDGWTDTKPTNASIVSRNFAKDVEALLTTQCVYSKNGSDSGKIDYIDRNLSVTVNTNMTSVLIELGFLSNPDENVRCANQNEQQNKANVVADEVKKCFNYQFKAYGIYPQAFLVCPAWATTWR